MCLRTGQMTLWAYTILGKPVDHDGTGHVRALGYVMIVKLLGLSTT